MPVTVPSPARPLTYPEMGSYRPDDTTWLVRDITRQVEEAGWEGGGHLGPSNPNPLPKERPMPRWQNELFVRFSHDLARDVAANVGVVAELALQSRGPGVAFASIIRAGVPVGVLLRRWLQWRHGLDTQHYAISIVPGDGLDTVALDYMAERHQPREVVFVDGWTGLGGIALEVEDFLDALAASGGPRFDPQLAVLVDHAECSDLYGTRTDQLLPTACLNSTSTGLTSKTVLHPRWVAGGHFHGVTRLPQFAQDDLSLWFVDLVSERFAEVVGEVDDRVVERLAGPAPRATFAGRKLARHLVERWVPGEPWRVKAGVGETVRLMVGYPQVDAVFVRPGAGAAVEPVVEMARAKGLSVTPVPDLPFVCAGLTGRRGKVV